MKYSLMEHERERWRTMTDKQLITRLNKTTTLEKLDCFIRLCHEFPDRHYLLPYAEERRRILQREGVSVPGYFTPNDPSPLAAILAAKRSLQKVGRVPEANFVIQSMNQGGNWKQPTKKEDKDEGDRYLDF